MVYISSLNMSSGLRQSVLQLQSNLSAAQQEVSTGVYADLGVQLGGTVSSAISLSQQSDQLSSLMGSNTTATTRLSATSSAIDTIQAAAQSMSNLLLGNASGGTLSQTIQSQAQSSMQALLGTLNTSVDGHYVFAGTNTANAPMVDATTAQTTVASALTSDLSNTAINPTGDPSQMTGAEMTAYLTGSSSNLSSLFSASGWSALSSASSTPLTSQISTSQSAVTSVSATQAAFQNIAEAYSILSGLSGQNLSSDASSAVVTQATSLLNQGISGLTALSSNIGVTQNSITDSNDQMTAQQTILTGNVSDLESVDTYTLSTQVTAIQTQLQDAFSLTNQLKSLSLVNYLTS